MKSEKSSSMLPDIFSIVGILFSAVFCFISLVHTLNGDLWVSAFVSLVLIIVLYKLPERLAFFKSRKVKRQIHRTGEDRWQEKVLLGIYALVAIPVFVLTLHFIFVEFANKNRIKQEGLDKWLEISKMEEAYNAAVSQEILVMETNAKASFSIYAGASGASKTAALDSLNTLLNTTASTMTQADFDNALTTRKNTTTASYSLDAFKTSNQFDKKMEEGQKAIKNWNFMKVGYYFKEGDKLFSDLYAEAQKNMPTFSYTAATASTLKLNDPIASVKDGGMVVLLIGLIVAILVNLCILAPYIAADRWLPPLDDVNSSDGPQGIQL
jgi:hypothetical protein